MRPIDADALKEKARELIPHYHAAVVMNLFDLIDNLADNMPTIEPRRGKWERHVLKNANVPWGYDCSACGAWFVVGDDTVEKYYYCPNCGARMERSEDGEA